MQVHVEILNSIISREVLKHDSLLRRAIETHLDGKKILKESYKPILDEIIEFIKPIILENQRDVKLLQAMRDDLENGLLKQRRLNNEHDR